MSSDASNARTAMTYRFLGNSGLLVSKLGLGSWMQYDAQATVDAWFDVMHTAFEHGVNFFDTAEFYGNGQAEELLGGAIKKGVADGVWTREDLVVTTKIFWGSSLTNAGPNDQGLSRKHIVEGTRASLRRLQLDYVDVIYCHRSEPFTPMEEVVRGMNHVINQGSAFYWGTSEWSSAEIREACEIADRLHLIRPIVEQPLYNILERNKVEYEFADLYKEYKLGLTVWSPLAMGILTGKYRNGIPEGSRFAAPSFRSYNKDFEHQVEIANELDVVAKQLGCSLAQLAIAWCISNEHVSTAILGARNAVQLKETLKAISVVDKLTPEVKSEIDAIVKFVPKLSVQDPTVLVRARHLGDDYEVPDAIKEWGKTDSTEVNKE